MDQHVLGYWRSLLNRCAYWPDEEYQPVGLQNPIRASMDLASPYHNRNTAGP